MCWSMATAPMRLRSPLDLVGKLLADGLDMVSAARVSQHADAYRAGHEFGNRALSGLVRRVFGRQFGDMLTGYRVFSRRFVKSFPANSAGFEIETEITVHALQMRLPAEEVETPYGARPDGSESKLNTFRDGLKILRMISLLVREERPLQFFGAGAFVALVIAAILGVPVVMDFARTHTVPRYPSLIVSVGLAMIAIISFACGVILDTVARGRLEQRRPGLSGDPGASPARRVLFRARPAASSERGSARWHRFTWTPPGRCGC